MAPKRFFLTKDPPANDPPRPHVTVVTVNQGMIERIEAESQARSGQTAELLSAALAVNDDSLDIVRRVEVQTYEMEGKLQHASDVLAEDRERIKRIDAKLKEMDGLLARARRELVYIVRNLCKDRCFTFLIIATLIAVSCVGAVFIRDSIAQSNQGKSTTVVVQPVPATPAPTTRSS